MIVGTGTALMLSGTPVLAAPNTTDVSLVYCTSPARRADLVAAVAVLGLAQRGATPDRILADGRDQSVEEWRTAHRDQFDRACEALIAARQHDTGAAASGGGTSWWSIIGTALVTGFLGWFFGALLAGAGARRLEAENLRLASIAFVGASQRLVRLLAGKRPGAPPPDDEVHQCRNALANALDQAGGRWFWRRPRQLRASLDGPRFGPAMTQGWWEDDETERRRDQLVTDLSRLGSEIERVAQALQTPARPHPGMWRE